MSIKRYIPNTITCLNLFSGCIACVMAFQDPHCYLFAALFVVLAAIFDFLDGMAARLLNVTSSIGKELDSLADVVSFGFAPAAIVYNWLTEISSNMFIPYFAFVMVVCSALRLAKFNLDERQTSSFIGLPTPANALFMAFLVAMVDPVMPAPEWVDLSWMTVPLSNQWLILALVLTFSLLLVCELPMFSLKFKHLHWKGNQSRFILIVLSLCLLILFQLWAIPLIIVAFIIMSVILSFSRVSKS